MMGQFMLRQKNYEMRTSCSRVKETFVACARTFVVYLFVLSIIYSLMSCGIQIEWRKKNTERSAQQQSTYHTPINGHRLVRANRT